MKNTFVEYGDLLNYSLKIWSLDDARVVRSIDHTEGKITFMTFRADSQYLITGGEDCSCKLWELSSGKLTQVETQIIFDDEKQTIFRLGSC